MMGAGIAYSCARAGMEVVLKDVAAENAEKGKAYSEKLLDKAIAKGRSTEEKKAELLARITADRRPGRPRRLRPGDRGGLRGPVAQEQGVRRDRRAREPGRAAVLQHLDAADHRAGRRAWTGPKDFIGLHFFSPVDKMPLVEIIRGEQTSDEALAKAYDVVQQIRKTPIVVNDSRGFYTSRVIGTMVNEGLAMLAEGVHPVSLERAATQDGYPVGVLQLTDELNMELFKKISTATRSAVEAAGQTYEPHPAEAVIDTMIELGRPSRLKGAGFYDYDESGKRLSLWKGLADTFPVAARERQGAVAVPGRQGPAAVRRGARDREVLRGGRHRRPPPRPTSARSWASASRPTPVAPRSS